MQRRGNSARVGRNLGWSYEGTAEYDKNKSFNRAKFLDWANEQTEPVFISEYQVKDERFREVWRIDKMSRMSSKSIKMKIEKLYANKVGLEKVKKRLKKIK